MLYRIFIWAVLAFEGIHAAGIAHVTLREPLASWSGMLLYHGAGYVLFEVLWFIGKKLKLALSPHIFLWLIAAYMHNVPGSVFGLFQTYPWYDQLAHFMLMGFFLAFIMHELTREWLRKRGITDSLVLFLAVFCATATLGVANEVLEYLLGLGTDTMTAFIPSASDTANDLLMNSLGSVLYLSIAWIRAR